MAAPRERPGVASEDVLHGIILHGLYHGVIEIRADYELHADLRVRHLISVTYGVRNSVNKLESRTDYNS